MCTQNQFTVQMFMKPVYSTDLENWKSWQLKERKKGEHTCPEVLIKLSELIKGLSINTNYNLAIISVFTVFKYCNRYVLTNSNSLINASGQVWELGREHSLTHHRLQSLELLLFAAKKMTHYRLTGSKYQIISTQTPPSPQMSGSDNQFDIRCQSSHGHRCFF